MANNDGSGYTKNKNQKDEKFNKYRGENKKTSNPHGKNSYPNSKKPYAPPKKDFEQMLQDFFSDPDTTPVKTKPKTRKSGYRGPIADQLPPDGFDK